MEHDQPLIDQLIGLGLTRYEAAAYMSLLGRQRFTPAQVATRSGVPRQRIYDVLAALCSRGLCVERHSGGRWFQAVDPALALPALVDERRRQQEAELARQQEQSRGLIAALTPRYSAGSSEDDPLNYVDVLLEPRLVEERALALAHTAEREVLVCFKPPLLGSAAENMEEVRVPLRRGIHYRALYERAALEDIELRDWMRQFAAWGQQLRLVDELPIKMNLFDERAALISLQDPLTGQPSITALCITHPSLTRTLKIAFEGLWASGEAMSSL
jgi:sugar-specific transcriptional regulator TrmB